MAKRSGRREALFFRWIASHGSQGSGVLPPLLSAGLLHAAAGEQLLPGQPPGVVCRQEGHNAGDFFRLADAYKRRSRRRPTLEA